MTETAAQGQALATLPIDNLLVTPANLEDAKQRLQMFRQFVSSVLIKNVDYGTIPGTEKDTLYKAGAERICQLFGLTPSIEFLEKRNEWDREPPFFYYEIKVILTRRGSGEVCGEGLGSANSKEKKYRYRKEFFNGAWGEVPSESGWTRAVKKYPDSNKKDYVYYFRINENLDTADQANTILKIAKKRALIDATLTVSAASEFFTQDLDDFSEESGPRKEATEQAKKNERNAKKETKETKTRESTGGGRGGGKTANQPVGDQCPDCNAPAPKHASKCPRKTAATAQDRTENENQDTRAPEHAKCQACHKDDGTHADGCPNMVIDADFTSPEGDEV